MEPVTSGSAHSKVPLQLPAVPARGGGWDKELVTGIPSHTVHKEAAQGAVSYFGPSGVGGAGGCSGLGDGLCLSLGCLQGINCSLCRMPRPLITSCPQRQKGGALSSSVNSKNSILVPHHSKLDFMVNLENISPALPGITS